MKKLRFSSRLSLLNFINNCFVFVFILAVTLIVNGFFITQVSAESVTKDFAVTSGVDASGDSPISFSSSEINKLSSVDTNRIQSNGVTWPKSGAYDENKYMEFIFSPDVPENAVIENITVVNNFRRSGALDGAKLEIWDGENFVDQEISKGSNTTTDNNESIDATSFIETSSQINNLKVRFLAYRGEGGNTKTSHDFIGLSVTYHESISDPDPDPEPDPNPDPDPGTGGGEEGNPNQPVIIDEDIEINTTWTKENSPYIIKSSVIVKEGVTLIIGEGTIVKFDSGSALLVDGAISVNGEDSDPVYFTSLLDDSIGGDTNEDGSDTSPSLGDWKYLMIESPTEISNLDNVFINYSANGVIVFDASVSSSNLNTDQKIILFNSEGNFDELKAESLISMEGSNLTLKNINLYNTIFIPTRPAPESVRRLSDNDKEIFESIEFNEKFIYEIDDGFFERSAIYSGNQSSKNTWKITYGDSASLSLYDKSIVFLSNSTILGGSKASYSTAIDIYGESSLVADSISVKNDSNSRTGIDVSYNSNLDIKNSTISDVRYGLSIFYKSSVNVLNSTVSCSVDCIELDASSLSLSTSKISGANSDGIGIYNNAFEEEVPVSITIINNEIFNNHYGVAVYAPVTFTGLNNSIHNNYIGAYNGIEETENNIINLPNNYWGDKTGPNNLTSNPLGLGNEVSDNIIFIPFLEKDPFEEVTGLSNIMFIPGFQASRMYKKFNNLFGVELEEKLWEPNTSGNIRDMHMDENGESLDKNIYTKDVMKTANIYGVGVLDIYKSFMDKLDEMVEKDEISEWQDIAYDWRLSPLDIVNRGIKKENGGISYVEELEEGQVPYIIGELKKLVDSSKTGKVTIVTHSNGGLVAESLISKLIEMKNSGVNNLIDNIDNLIVVAPPLVGTPEATVGILHGYDQGTFFNIVKGRKNARDLGINLPGAYGLIPSEKYISEVDNNLIYLNESLDEINNWRSIYGESVNTFEEFKNFLLNIYGIRIQPGYDDLVNPIILNKNVLDKAELLHKTIDNVKIPENIKFYQIAGWGLPTPYNFSYKSKNKCSVFKLLSCLKKEKVLSSDLDFTYGDKTVVAGSALYGEGTDYYLNLYKYNKDTKFEFNKKHVNIFEVPSVFDLFDNILKNTNNDLPEYITKIEPDRNISFTILKMRSPVSMDIYSEDGTHTGLVENEDPELEKIEENIPNSLYMEIGEEKYIVVPSEGNYKLKLTGLSDGIFTLEQEQIINNEKQEPVIFQDILTTELLRGEMDLKYNLLSTNLSLDKDGDGVFESNINPTDLSLPEEPSNDIIIKRKSGGSSLSNNLNLALLDEKSINIENKKINNNSAKSVNIIKADNSDKGFNNVSKEEIRPENNKLTASADSSDGSNPNKLKYQLIMSVCFILLLLSFKFVFKIL